MAYFSDRDMQIFELRVRRGWTYQRIADACGLSRARIGQVVKHGLRTFRALRREFIPPERRRADSWERHQTEFDAHIQVLGSGRMGSFNNASDEYLHALNAEVLAWHERIKEEIVLRSVSNRKRKEAESA